MSQVSTTLCPFHSTPLQENLWSGTYVCPVVSCLITQTRKDVLENRDTGRDLWRPLRLAGIWRPLSMYPLLAQSFVGWTHFYVVPDQSPKAIEEGRWALQVVRLRLPFQTDPNARWQAQSDGDSIVTLDVRISTSAAHETVEMVGQPRAVTTWEATDDLDDLLYSLWKMPSVDD